MGHFGRIMNRKGTATIGIPVVVCSLALAALEIGSPAFGPCPTPPAAVAISSVPFVKQHGDWCGPAALASVLQYYGEEITRREIAEAIYLPEMRGSLNLDLLLYPRTLGYETAQSEGDLTTLKAALARGIPVICQIREKSGFTRRYHFVVVFGYDDASRRLLLHSGASASEQWKYGDFEKKWRRADCWMLTIEPKGSETASRGENEANSRQPVRDDEAN